MGSQAPLQALKGLFAQANSFSGVPDGALELASNVVINQDGILRKRRGFSLFHTPTGGRTASVLFEYLSTIYTIYADSIGKLDTSGTATILTGETVSISSVGTPRTAQANGNAYVTTDSGLLKIESLTSALLKAGIPRGLDVTVLMGQSVALTNTGPIDPDTQVGYRVVFGRTDANNNKVLGAPSEFAISINRKTLAASAALPGVVVRVTSANHGLVPGDTVVISGAVGTGTLPSGEYIVTTTPTASIFDITPATLPTTITALDWGIFKTPKLEITIPTGLTTENIVQIYRSSQSISAATSPSEDLQLVDEFNLTSGQITAGFLTYYDEVDDLFKGAYLYTNPNSGQGILQSNEVPPYCTDVALFKNNLFFANAKTKFTKSISLVSVSTTNFAAGRKITVTSNAVTRTYVATTSLPASAGGAAAATPNTSTNWDYGGVNASGEFYFYLKNSGGSVTVSEGIDATARSICKAINRDTSSLVYVYYTSSPDGTPGTFSMVSKGYTYAFYVQANNSAFGIACFSPELPTSGQTVIGVQDVQQNVIYFSKDNQPEAVPTINTIPVGSKSYAILRIIPLRDSLIVLKTDGVFRVTGESAGNFVVSPLDGTVVCKASNSVVALANEIYCLSDQGVVAISDSSVRVVSRDVEDYFTAIIGQSYLEAQTKAVAYQTERMFLLSTVSPSASTADTVYCFNTVTNAWTTWGIETCFQSAIVSQTNDRLYFINNANTILKERKNRNKLDFADRSFACVASNVIGLTCELSVSGAIPEVGDVVVIDDIINRIVSISTATGTAVYTFLQAPSFESGESGLLYDAISSQIKTAPLTSGDTSRAKQTNQFQLWTRSQALSKATLSFITNAAIGSVDITWRPIVTSSGWGISPWGLFPWGLEEGIVSVIATQTSQPLVTLIPANCQRNSWIQALITHAEAAEDLSIQTLAFNIRPYGNRVSK